MHSGSWNELLSYAFFPFFLGIPEVGEFVFQSSVEGLQYGMVLATVNIPI